MTEFSVLMRDKVEAETMEEAITLVVLAMIGAKKWTVNVQQTGDGDMWTPCTVDLDMLTEGMLEAMQEQAEAALSAVPGPARMQ
jgi:hypothetical protein